MRILYINTVYKKGSTGRLISQLADAVGEKGDQFEIAFGRGANSEDNIFKVGNNADLCLHAFWSRLTDRSGFFSKTATKKLIKRIKKFQPDIIHLHNLHGYYLNLPILFNYLSKEFKGQIIWTLHDCWGYTGHCTYYSFAECDRWKYGCGDCPQKREYPKSIYVDNSMLNLKEKKNAILSVRDRLCIVTVSNWLLSEVKRSFLYQCKKTVCIYNGVDLNLFKPTENNVKEQLGILNKFMILCVSDGWDKRKGYDRVIELSKQIDDDSVIVMVGLDSSQIEELPDNIIGLTKTRSQIELARLYSAADVFFNPSREETFGLVTIEAMACGTPVVVYDTTACTELVNETCGLVLPNDFSIQNGYKNIYLNKKEMTHFCVARACDFSIAKMTNQYYKLYKNADSKDNLSEVEYD